MIQCTRCKQSKANPEFWPDKRKRNGLSSWCRECHLDFKTEWRKTVPQRERMSGAEYRRRQKEQRPNTPPRPVSCEICDHVFTNGYHDAATWDHNHATGIFRGWLCGHCNRTLGSAKDSPAILRAAANYLDARGHA